MELNIDKTTWKKVKLGDVAIEYSKRINNPSDSEFDRFIGSSNIKQWDFRIKSWESTSSVTSAMKLFEPNDYLLVRRSLYASDFRERAPRASFHGVCSGDILTIKENKEFIADGFLIGILNSPALWKYVVANGSGSITRRIHWKDLANYEFLLPPKDKQKQIAELLWAMDEVIEKKIKLKDTANIHYEVAKSNLVLEGLKGETFFAEHLKRQVSKNWKITTVGELLKKNYILKIQDGNHGETHPKSSDYVDAGIPFIMANTLIDGKIEFDKSKKLPQTITDKLRIGFSYPDDVLLSHKGTVGEVALVPNKIDYPYLMLTPQVTLYRTNPDKLINRFLYYVFNTSYFQDQILQLSSQSTRAYVGITSQRNFKLAIPQSIKEQTEIIEVLSKIENNRKSIDDSISISKSLQKSIINQIFLN